MYKLKENPFESKSIGKELFFRKQFLLNPKINEQYQTSFASFIYYYLCKMNIDAYRPKRYVKIII